MDMFANVAHFSLDLRNNKMSSMSRSVFYNDSRLEEKGTKILEGTKVVGEICYGIFRYNAYR